MNTPSFAVVGHPNKGKSSLVATLSQDDSVQISTRPGTTVKARYFPMKVDGKTLYQLIDTPGFQRAHQAITWLKDNETEIHERPNIVADFIETFKNSDKFFDEVQLLTPIMAGAGILYVVDGSKPYGNEFEAEMEILRWTGQPSMALINLIGEDDYSEQWHNALTQFFQIVRVFSAVSSDFAQHLELLNAFGQLKSAWREPLAQAVNYLLDDYNQRGVESASLIAQLIIDSMSYTYHEKTKQSELSDDLKMSIEQTFFQHLQDKEQQSRRMIENLHHFHHIERREKQISILDEDLFSTQSWSIFGLTDQELIMTGIVSGAAMGAVIDVAVGGASLLLGAGIGAIFGAITTVFTQNKMAEINFFGLELGGKMMQIGPIRKANFPYVLLGRAILHYQKLTNRSHAIRDQLVLQDKQGNTGASTIDPDLRQKMELIFKDIRNNKHDNNTEKKLAQLIQQVLKNPKK